MKNAASQGRAARRPAVPRRLGLRLHEGTPGEAYGRLAAALDAGRISAQEFDVLTRSLERRLRVLDAERLAAQVEAAKAAAIEAARIAGEGRRQMPAAQRVLTAEARELGPSAELEPVPQPLGRRDVQ